MIDHRKSKVERATFAAKDVLVEEPDEFQLEIWHVPDLPSIAQSLWNVQSGEFANKNDSY